MTGVAPLHRSYLLMSREHVQVSAPCRMVGLSLSDMRSVQCVPSIYLCKCIELRQIWGNAPFNVGTWRVEALSFVCVSCWMLGYTGPTADPQVTALVQCGHLVSPARRHLTGGRVGDASRRDSTVGEVFEDIQTPSIIWYCFASVVEHGNEKSLSTHVLMGKSNINLWFSSAMFDNQMVYWIEKSNCKILRVKQFSVPFVYQQFRTHRTSCILVFISPASWSLSEDQQRSSHLRSESYLQVRHLFPKCSKIFSKASSFPVVSQGKRKTSIQPLRCSQCHSDPRRPYWNSWLAGSASGGDFGVPPKKQSIWRTNNGDFTQQNTEHVLIWDWTNCRSKVTEISTQKSCLEISLAPVSLTTTWSKGTKYNRLFTPIYTNSQGLQCWSQVKSTSCPFHFITATAIFFHSDLGLGPSSVFGCFLSSFRWDMYLWNWWERVKISSFPGWAHSSGGRVEVAPAS